MNPDEGTPRECFWIIEQSRVDITPVRWYPIELTEVPIHANYDHKYSQSWHQRFPYSPYCYDSYDKVRVAFQELLEARQKAIDTNGAVNRVYLAWQWRIIQVTAWRQASTPRRSV